MFKTMQDIVVCHTLVGGTFFTKAEVEAVERNTIPYLYGGKFFVTHEIVGNDATLEVQQPLYAWVIWKCKEDGTIQKIDQFHTERAAKSYAHDLAYRSREWPLYQSIEDVKQANKDAGEYFFSSGTRHFFNERTGTTVYGGRYFTGSIQDKPSDDRLYYVAEIDKEGHIHYVKKDLSAYMARKIAKELGNNEDNKYREYYR